MFVLNHIPFIHAFGANPSQTTADNIQHLRQLFDSYDRNKSGRLNEGEFTRLITQADRTISNFRAHELFNSFNTNGVRGVNKNEFFAGVITYYFSEYFTGRQLFGKGSVDSQLVSELFKELGKSPTDEAISNLLNSHINPDNFSARLHYISPAGDLENVYNNFLAADDDNSGDLSPQELQSHGFVPEYDENGDGKADLGEFMVRSNLLSEPGDLSFLDPHGVIGLRNSTHEQRQRLIDTINSRTTEFHEFDAFNPNHVSDGFISFGELAVFVHKTNPSLDPKRLVNEIFRQMKKLDDNGDRKLGLVEWLTNPINEFVSDVNDQLDHPTRL